MSVDLLSEREVHQIASAALARGVVTSRAEAETFARWLWGLNVDAFLERYPRLGATAAQPLAAAAADYLFVEVAVCDRALLPLIERCIYNTDVAAAWPTSMPRRILDSLWRAVLTRGGEAH
jgi:hypothetical protein